MIKTVENGCPLCHGDVKGNDEAKYFCKKCNILFNHTSIIWGKPKSEDKKPIKIVDLDYIGSVESDKYHKLSCMCAGNILKENRIIFEGREDAIKKGYRRCGMCMKKKKS